MRIEEINKQRLEKATDQELQRLRYQTAQFWDRHFKTNTKTIVGCFERHIFIAKYRLLLKEMESPKRSLQLSTCDIDRRAFEQSMQVRAAGIDVALLTEFITGNNCVILDKDFAEADELKLTIQQVAEEPDEWLEEEITKILGEQFDKPCVFDYVQNFEGEGIPLFHEVLVPVTVIEKIHISTEAEEIEKDIELIPIEKGDEHIVYGIVYEPDTEDAQGDQATAAEIKKAAYNFMEHVQTFKVMHKGKKVKIRILENYIAPVDFTIGKRKVKKGSWMLVTRVLDEQVWKDIKAGKLTGYSMAGYAKIE